MNRELLEALAQGEGRCVLVVVLAVQGSGPRGPGAALLLLEEGASLGTVGGGRGELAARELGLSLLAEGGARLLDIEMLGEDAAQEGMICGGRSLYLLMSVEDRQPFITALERLAQGRPSTLVFSLIGENENLAVTVEVEEAGPSSALTEARYSAPERCLRIAIQPEEKLLILGAGHVGLALAKAARGLGFSIFLADDRVEFLEPARLPEKVQALPGPLTSTLSAFPFDRSTYVVVVTPGHLQDLACARSLLGRPLRYAGLIGSARKVRLLKEALAAEGFAQEAIAALFAPIGIDIGAETPEEIAISVLAEIIAMRREPGLLTELSISRRSRG